MASAFVAAFFELLAEASANHLREEGTGATGPAHVRNQLLPASFDTRGSAGLGGVLLLCSIGVDLGSAGGFLLCLF